MNKVDKSSEKQRASSKNLVNNDKEVGEQCSRYFFMNEKTKLKK